MKPVIPDLYRKFSPDEYEIEFNRIDFELNKFDEIDFEIIVNNDIPFLCELQQLTNGFERFRNMSFIGQKSHYANYLKMMFMFPLNYQRN